MNSSSQLQTNHLSENPVCRAVKCYAAATEFFGIVNIVRISLEIIILNSFLLLHLLPRNRQYQSKELMQLSETNS